MAEEEQKWLEEEEEEALLQVRKSRSVQKNDIKIPESYAINLAENNEPNGHAIQSNVTENGAHKEESTLSIEENHDKVEGTDFTYSNSGNDQIEKNPGNIQPSHVTYRGNSESYTSSEDISSDVDETNVDELEETDLDVERVLQTQTTHDLYCPNCNSCITRRVILRKRKRRIKISEVEVKRNKTEISSISHKGISSVEVSDDVFHLHGTTEVGVEDDVDRDSGPDLFRCLSCLSFFIPTGNGFKLFPNFGDKYRKENVVEAQIPNRKKNWFVSMFASKKQGMAAERDAPHGSGVVRNTGNTDTQGHGYKILLSPRHELVSNGLKIHSSELMPEKIKTEKIDIETEPFEVYANQLNEPKISKEVQVTSDSHLLVTTLLNKTLIISEDSAQDALLHSRKGGLNLEISSNVQHALEKSEEGKIINQIIQKGRSDEEIIQILPTHVSIFKTLDLDKTLNISEAIPLKEQHAEAKVITESEIASANGNLTSNDGGVYSTGVSQHIIQKTKIEVQTGETLKVDSILSVKDSGNDTLITIDALPASVIDQVILVPEETASSLHTTTQVGIAVQGRTERGQVSKIEVIKCIVYAGLSESITSLSVVSSASGGDAATLNILALGIANLIGGFFIICHNLWELRCDKIVQVSDLVSNQVTEQKDRYKELLGRRENFILHAIVCILSYLLFGLMPIVVYGFSFQKSDDKELKLLVVGAVSLLCIIVLSIGKAYVCRPPKAYLKTVVNFVMLGFMVSGISYAAGVLVKRLLDKLGLFQSTSVDNLILPFKDSAWASY